MARPLRVEYADALYHICYRGNNGQDIFHDSEDREYFIDRLRQTVNRYQWRLFAFCQMTNHGLCGASHKMCYVKCSIM